jgi:hypothetical protein
MGFGMHGLIDLRIEDHLGEAFAIAQIHEYHTAMIPPAQDPPHQYDFFSNVFRTQLTAAVSFS